jgi:hypothetical protein
LQFILEEYDEANAALDIRVRQHKTNFKPTKPFGVRFTFAEKKVSIENVDLPDTELIDESYVPVKERIVAALKAGEATIRDLAELTGAEVGTIRNKISELKGEKVVVDAGYRGREKLYSLLSSSENPYREPGDDDNNGLTPGQVASVLDNPDFSPGPARALAEYREDPSAENLARLTRSIRFSLGLPTEGWEDSVGVVRAAIE